jgi:autotransporter-associated beta strand protein
VLLPADFSGSTAASVNASVVKNGSGTLTLAGNNTYSGGTTVRGGLLLAGSHVVHGEGNQIISGPFGTGTITLDGGGVGAAAGYVLANPISFGTAGGTLGGSGTIASAITAGTNVTVAPGNSPGQLTFTSNLTLASGGVASFDISNFAGSAGSGWDQIVVSSTGTLALTATIANPFTIQINSWSESSNSLGALTSDFSAPVSLAIFQTSATITGLIGDGQAGSSNLVLNTGNFTAYQPGQFSLSLSTDSTALLLNFTPVPEPSTYALFGAGLLLVAGSVWRSKRARRD